MAESVSDRVTVAAAPAALLAVLLLAATLFDGAFDVRHWAPVALFALVLLAATLLAGGARPVSGPIKVALAAIWGFAAWTLLSAAWAESPALAWEGGALAVLYAALVTVALVAVPGSRQMNMIGAGLIGGVVLLAVVTLLRMHAEGTELFVAGRLDSPAGYRNATAALFALAFWPLIGLAVTRGRNPSLRGAAVASAVLCLGLAFITQSRGVIVALAAGGVVALVLGTERIRR
ncbi:MAG: O-antigen ligase family protein, partial [Thermoleophilaceae bacterium]